MARIARSKVWIGDLLNLEGTDRVETYWPNGQRKIALGLEWQLRCWDDKGEPIALEDISMGWATNNAEEGEIIYAAEWKNPPVWEIQSSTSHVEGGTPAPESAN